MPVIRKYAVQGRPNAPLDVRRMYSPKPPFPPELFSANPRSEERVPHGDSLHESLDDIRYFRCRDCGEIMPEHDMHDHICIDEADELGQTSYYGFEDD